MEVHALERAERPWASDNSLMVTAAVVATEVLVFRNQSHKECASYGKLEKNKGTGNEGKLFKWTILV